MAGYAEVTILPSYSKLIEINEIKTKHINEKQD